MADRFVDGQLVGGGNTGVDWANACNTQVSLQAAVDQLVAGNTLHCARTFTLTAPVDIDAASGTDGNPIIVQGYNYNGGTPTVDGTRSVFDANGAAAQCFHIADEDDWLINDIEFCNATANNVSVTAVHIYRWMWVNCISHDAGNAGWNSDDDSGRWVRCSWCLCQSYDNGAEGWRGITTACMFVYCIAIGNVGYGIYGGLFTVVYGLLHSNVSNVYGATGTHVISSVIDTATNGVNLTAAGIVTGCRITNNTNGIQMTTATILDIHNLYYNNTNNTNGATVFPNVNGTSTQYAATGTGYYNAVGNDFHSVFGSDGYTYTLDLNAVNSVKIIHGLPYTILNRRPKG